MATVEEKLSDRIETFLTENGFVHIILPSGAPSGFSSYKIDPEYLRGFFKQRFAAQSANFTMLLDANVRLEEIGLIWISGTPVIKVGTSLGTNDVISGRTLSSIKNSINPLADWFKDVETLYFTITGGTADIVVFHKKLYNS